MCARKCVDVFLQPGEYFVGNAAHTIRTLLGSCVSITLWHPAKKVGAMSHFLLPRRDKPVLALPDGRYGEEALWLMLRELARKNIEPTECQAKIFGGGSMFPGQSPAAAPQIGERNGEAARALVRAHRIEIVSESLFGAGHRQIRFDVQSGHVWARQVELSVPE